MTPDTVGCIPSDWQ